MVFGAQQGAAGISGTGPSNISAIWANEGGDKVTKDELRASTGGRAVLNSTWDGHRINVFGAKNEIIGFNLVLEAASHRAEGVSVRFERLVGPDKATIQSVPVGKDGVFDWTRRPIELFFIRYLPIQGLSRLAYETYDERHIPERLRRPRTSDGQYVGAWTDRPDHDKEYPDIAVPLEVAGAFSIPEKQNQSVWIDIYIPKSTPKGLYSGVIVVSERGGSDQEISIALNVRDFTLPDVPTSKTMIATGYDEVARRYAGEEYPQPGSPQDSLTRTVLDRQMLVAHRHKLALIGENGGVSAWKRDEPRPDWIPRLDGTLFSAAHGYAGPGANVGNGVFSIGTYGEWRGWWGGAFEQAVWSHTDGWESWFIVHFPKVEHFLYLADESHDYAQTEMWASWIKENPGVGRSLKSFATAGLPKAQKFMPSLDITASSIAVADRDLWQSAADRVAADHRHQFFLYNGGRPGSGSFATDDDGVALRELPWGQYKKGIERWFYWEATYYKDFQGGRGETHLFRDAQTFGGPVAFNANYGRIGWNSTNGDGVLFYPGTDLVYPEESYGLAGPIVSLRMKYWRRGIQDIDYVALAHAVDPGATDAIVSRMVPKVLWENGVNDPNDPTWALCPISWSTDPDDWERAREELADIIERPRNGQKTAPPVSLR